MRTYHGQRTEKGCEVTVNGEPLKMRSDLSGNATTAFDWGYVGGGQLSLALLADYFESDSKAQAMAEVFEREVIARLPTNLWSLTGYALAMALAPLVGVDGARADDGITRPTSDYRGNILVHGGMRISGYPEAILRSINRPR